VSLSFVDARTSEKLTCRDGDIVSISVKGDELDITSRPDPSNMGTSRPTADDVSTESRTLEVLEEVEDDVDPVAGMTAHA
jgi:hypothetical protein